MDYQLYMNYKNKLPQFIATNGILEALLKDAGFSLQYIGNSGIRCRNKYIVFPTNWTQIHDVGAEVDISEEELDKLVTETISKYEECVKIQKALTEIIDLYFKSMPSFSADQKDLYDEIDKTDLKIVKYGRSGFDFRNTYYVLPNDEQEIVTRANRYLNNYDSRESDYIDYEDAKEVIQFLQSLTPESIEMRAIMCNSIVEQAKTIVDDINNRRDIFKKAQVHICADQYQLIDILERIEGVSLRYIGRSGFDSRNSVAINVIPEIDEDKDDISLDISDEQRIISNIVYHWSSIQLFFQQKQDFITAFNANNQGVIGIVPTGGKNRKYEVPDNYQCILSVKTANTEDHRQNLTHSYDSVYIDLSRIKNVSGVLHIDLPKEYIGMFIGAKGSHVKEILAELQQINPKITNIKVHEKEFSPQEPVFVSILPETISREDVIVDYLEKYAKQEEIDTITAFFEKRNQEYIEDPNNNDTDLSPENMDDQMEGFDQTDD